jgi:hypothetical protein
MDSKRSEREREDERENRQDIQTENKIEPFPATAWVPTSSALWRIEK